MGDVKMFFFVWAQPKELFADARQAAVKYFYGIN
jgi:hypothetical protein